MTDLGEAAAVAGGAIYGWLSSSSTSFFAIFLQAFVRFAEPREAKRSVHVNYTPRRYDIDSPSRPSFKTRKGLKQNAFSKNEWPKRFAGTGK